MEHGDILDLKFVNGYSMLQLMATNPAPVEVVVYGFIPLFTGFYTSQVGFWDF